MRAIMVAALAGSLGACASATPEPSAREAANLQLTKAGANVGKNLWVASEDPLGVEVCQELTGGLPLPLGANAVASLSSSGSGSTRIRDFSTPTWCSSPSSCCARTACSERAGEARASADRYPCGLRHRRGVGGG